MTVTRRPNLQMQTKSAIQSLSNAGLKILSMKSCPIVMALRECAFLSEIAAGGALELGAPQWHNHSLKPASTLMLPLLQSSRALEEQRRRDIVKIHPNGPSIGFTQQACSIPLSTADSYRDVMKGADRSSFKDLIWNAGQQLLYLWLQDLLLIHILLPLTFSSPRIYMLCCLCAWRWSNLPPYNPSIILPQCWRYRKEMGACCSHCLVCCTCSLAGLFPPLLLLQRLLCSVSAEGCSKPRFTNSTWGLEQSFFSDFLDTLMNSKNVSYLSWHDHIYGILVAHFHAFCG